MLRSGIKKRLLLSFTIPAIFGVFVCAALYLFATAPPPSSRGEMESASAYLRGRAYMVIRLPTPELPVDQIQIFENGDFARALLPNEDPLGFVQAPLPEEMQSVARTIHNQWCAQSPTFTKIDEGEYFEVALDCGGAALPVFLIPQAELPAELQQIIDQLPPAPVVD